MPATPEEVERQRQAKFDEDFPGWRNRALPEEYVGRFWPKDPTPQEQPYDTYAELGED